MTWRNRSISRRRFLVAGIGASWAWLSGATSCAASRPEKTPGGVILNDVQSRLNPTPVRRVERPTTVHDLVRTVRNATRRGEAVSISGARHAMGGQQFGTNHAHLDLTGLSRIVELDRESGEVEVEGGTIWPVLMTGLENLQVGGASSWGIVQKQTGLDHLTVGGALAANIHGRGLSMPPIVSNVSAFTLVAPDGELVRCTRDLNPELFRAAIGGYGLFGPMASIRLRLAKKRKVERVVELRTIAEALSEMESRAADGWPYGDFQFSCASESEEYLRGGVLNTYRYVADDALLTGRPDLSADQFRELALLAHSDPARAWELYKKVLLEASGLVYWHDDQQRSLYVSDYHEWIDPRDSGEDPATEMLTEVHIPRSELVAFMEETARDFREHRVKMIYGVVRLIEKDEETLLAWARQPWACVIFNIHTAHAPAGIERSRTDVRRLIDNAIRRGGSYYLTYHRWARPGQVMACHPRLPELFALKRRFDPAERFSSDWYLHYRALVA